MYKITVLFESNIPGIYTKEEETADSKEWIDKKSIRILGRWLKILEDRIHDGSNEDDDVSIKIHLLYINQAIKRLNKNDGGNRKFTFTVEEI